MFVAPSGDVHIICYLGESEESIAEKLGLGIYLVTFPITYNKCVSNEPKVPRPATSSCCLGNPKPTIHFPPPQWPF